MSYEPKDNSGSLFRNEKRDNDSQPEYRGDAKVVCPHCRASFLTKLSAWVNEAASGKKYFGIKFGAPREAATAERRPERKASSGDAPW